MPRFRFFWRLYFGYAVLIVLVSVSVGMVLSIPLKRSSMESLRRELYQQALCARAFVDKEDRSRANLQQKVKDLGQSLGFRWTVLNSQGLVLADSGVDLSEAINEKDREEIIRARSWSQPRGMPKASLRESDGVPSMFLALPASKGFVRVSTSLSRVEEELAWWDKVLALAALLAALLGFGGNFLLARWLSSPLSTVSALAESIARRAEKDQGFGAAKQDEIGTLSWAFQRMSENLRQKMEATFHHRRELRAILDGMVEGVIAVDREETIVQMNDVAGRLLKVTASHSSGRKLWECVRTASIIKTVNSVLQDGRALRRELRVPLGPREKIIELYAAPLFDAPEEGKKGNTVAGAVLVLYDVTRLRSLEAMRRNFIANISHELKTPLTAVRGLVETMLDDLEMPVNMRARFLGKASKQADRLTVLVSDLLHLSRVESEKDALKREWLDLRDPIRETVLRLTPVAEKKNLTLKVHLPASAVRLKGDEECLQQLIGNLLSNAIQYSPEDETINLKVEQGEDEVTLMVQDNGVGIESIHHDRIFQRFYRVDKARSRELGGTGLGLSIVKHIAYAHDGRVWVESIPGTGSTFFVKFSLIESPELEAEM